MRKRQKAERHSDLTKWQKVLHTDFASVFWIEQSQRSFPEPETEQVCNRTAITPC